MCTNTNTRYLCIYTGISKYQNIRLTLLVMPPCFLFFVLTKYWLSPPSLIFWQCNTTGLEDWLDNGVILHSEGWRTNFLLLSSWEQELRQAAVSLSYLSSIHQWLKVNREVRVVRERERSSEIIRNTSAYLGLRDRPASSQSNLRYWLFCLH